jgi:hypothetical protein
MDESLVKPSEENNRGDEFDRNEFAGSALESE